MINSTKSNMELKKYSTLGVALVFLLMTSPLTAQISHYDGYGAGARSWISLDARPPAWDQQWNVGLIYAEVTANASGHSKYHFDIIDGDGSGWNRTLTLATTPGTVATGFVGIGNVNPAFPLHMKSFNSNEWQAVWENGEAKAYLAHEGGFGMYLTTGKPNSSSRYAMQVANADQTHFYIRDDGNIGIGVNAPDAKLHVDGKIISEEVKIQVVNGADFVFEEEFELRTLEETEVFIMENKHLPEIPSAAEMKEKGLVLGEMNILLLQKIEELTLHLIRQQKEIDDLKATVK